jgi:hypothetical protein
VLWTANTERMCNIQSYHKTAEELLQAIEVWRRSIEEPIRSELFV